MKKLLLNAAVAAVVAASAVPAFAGAVAGATEPTQIMNNLELVIQEAHQAQMVMNSLASIQSLGQMNWGTASQDLSNLTQVVSSGNAIAYSSSNMATAFNQAYPGYVPNMNYQQSYAQWGQNSLENIRGALSAAGMQSNQFGTERAALNAIQALANNPVGQTQAIQAGTQIASQQVDQLQKLRQLMMAQISAQGTYMAGETQKHQAQVGAQQSYFTPYTPTAPTFSSSGGSN